MTGPGMNIGTGDIGRNYQRHPRRRERTKDAPIFTEQRGLDRWDALHPDDAARIRAEAQAAAREAIQRFERRTGRRVGL